MVTIRLLLYIFTALERINAPFFSGWPLFFVIALMLTVTMATLSYYLIERPFLALKERYATILSRPV